MNRSFLRRLRALELRFPERLPDFSGVPMRDLEALEGYMERARARGDMSEDWESELPARLQRILRKAELGGFDGTTEVEDNRCLSGRDSTNALSESVDGRRGRTVSAEF